jgi:peptide/nickel transport system permease protein
MIDFALKRSLGLIIVLLLTSFVVFALIGLMPGDPIDLLMSANPNMMPEDVAKLKAIYGVDQPLWTRYTHWLADALHGDFGFSRIQHRPVLEVVLPALGNTIILTFTAFIISAALALVLGTLAAVNQGRLTDRLISFFAFLGISVPGFWLGLVFIYLFAVKLGVLPAGGMPRADQPYPAIAYLVLPCLTLILIEIGGLTRYVRSAVIEALGQDYIRTARAKGQSESRIVWRHALRNAMIPIMTIIALGFGHLLSGATLIETMFGWRGMGRLIYEAIMGNDYNLALVCLLFTTTMVLIGSIIADVSYALLDPRIGLSGKQR